VADAGRDDLGDVDAFGVPGGAECAGDAAVALEFELFAGDASGAEPYDVVFGVEVLRV